LNGFAKRILAAASLWKAVSFRFGDPPHILNRPWDIDDLNRGQRKLLQPVVKVGS
jgi:hypothetical protein